MIDVLHVDCLDLDARTMCTQLVYADPPFFVQKDQPSFADTWRDIDQYTRYVTARLAKCWDILLPSGVMIVHLDWHASHYIKVALDKVCGYDHFLNEIIWKYNSGGASKRWLARKHDTLLVYVKGEDYTFNVQREPYATPNVQGRAGFHPDGRMMNDVWEISFISTTSSERTGYSTQKPLALLKRLLTVFSNPGDLVLDPFAGSGTTGVAAGQLGRRAVLCDTNPDAIALINRRMGEQGTLCILR